MDKRPIFGQIAETHSKSVHELMKKGWFMYEKMGDEARGSGGFSK
jgi:hypothetical protein